MDEIVLEITIPEKVSLNRIYAGMFWRRRAILAKLYHDEFLDVKGKMKVTKYPVVISYDFHFKSNPLDTLNCSMMAKMLEDGMVKIGILEDDCPKYVRRSIIDTQLSSEYKNDTVVVTIRPLE